MKTGKPSRLSEKLNADMEEMRAEHAILMASQLENLRNDIAVTVKDAKDTIETDTAHFLFHNKSWFEERTREIRDWLTISPWRTGSITLAGIALMMVASWFWAEIMTRSEMAEMGMTRFDQAGRTWMILDPDRTEIKTCTLDEWPVLCIEIKE